MKKSTIIDKEHFLKVLTYALNIELPAEFDPIISDGDLRLVVNALDNQEFTTRDLSELMVRFGTDRPHADKLCIQFIYFSDFIQKLHSTPLAGFKEGDKITSIASFAQGQIEKIELNELNPDESRITVTWEGRTFVSVIEHYEADFLILTPKFPISDDN